MEVPVWGKSMIILFQNLRLFPLFQSIETLVRYNEMRDFDLLLFSVEFNLYRSVVDLVCFENIKRI